MDIKYKRIGSHAALRRKELGITQVQLAEYVGVSKNHISRFEHGGSVSLEVFLKLCDALEITPDYMLFGTIRNNEAENVADLLKLCDSYELSVIYSTAAALLQNRTDRKNRL